MLSFNPFRIKATNPRSGTETFLQLVRASSGVSRIKATNPRSGTETDTTPGEVPTPVITTYQSHESPLGD